jgi:hypothetical protein
LPAEPQKPQNVLEHISWSILTLIDSLSRIKYVTINAKGFSVNNSKPKSIAILVVLTIVVGSMASAIDSHAQGIVASATLSGVPGAGSTFDYTLTLNNAPTATTPIEGFWYAWIPGFFFLPSTPSSASGGASGWSATIDSTSIQFQGNAGNAIAAGGSATFTFVTTDSPSALAGTSDGFPIGSSVAYPGTINFSDSSPNEEITVQSVPEPSSFGLLITGLLGLLATGWRKLRAR